MNASVALFSGEPQPFGGLSNEKDLAAACPQEFKEGSRWSDFAVTCFSNGADTAGWKWKTDDKVERRHQRDCLRGLLETFELSHEDKVAVAGWMLSEMISEVPTTD